MTVLILCHGNICRSPVAAAVMEQAGFSDIETAGFKPEQGKKSPKKVRDYMLGNCSIDLEKHRSKAVTPEMLETAELVLYMDGGQAKRLEALWASHGLEEKRGPWVNFCEPLARYLKEPGDKIGDPMFQKGGSEEFNLIMRQLIEASRNFVDQRSQAPIVTEGVA